jgi:carboxyl-terminal processing protease
MSRVTDSGRELYGGGGIAPDEKFVPSKLNKFQIELLNSTFFNFTAKFFGSKEKVAGKAGNLAAVLNDFHAYLLKEMLNSRKPMGRK